MSKEVLRNEHGKPFSKWKPAEKFAYVWREYGIHPAEREVVFDEVRKWRLDFAWPLVRVGVEIDGFGYGHQAQQCMAEDNEKANAAIERGWKVLRFNSRQLGSRAGVVEAVDQVNRVLCGAKVNDGESA